ncbi:hypothetical protein FRB99_007418 [Tulasnella sp. 403]|nr:hypothetical protein FRB99_007418 [Tulasnella sp. 403]
MNSTCIDQRVFEHNTSVAVVGDAHNATFNETGPPAVDIVTALPQMLSTFQPLLSNGYLQNSLNFFLFGTVLETGRRLWQWLMDRFTGGFVLTAIFDCSDPAYEWFSAYLNNEKIWSTTRQFQVTARTTSRTWGVNSGDGDNGHVEYMPTYDQPQLFRFKGTWCQVTRTKGENSHNMGHEDGGQLVLTLYTRKRAILDELIENAHAQYMRKSKPRLVVHGTDHCGSWCQTTTKARRPLDSLILPNGVKEMLLNDAKEFLRSEAWYAEAGIQHKRGYLLYGPPGTGKSSTIHALAGELDLEIYSLSLAANGLDDAGLSRLIASTPAHSMILIEDIDCAFPSREELEKQKEAKASGITLAETKSSITLSGLLNVIDGVSSEEGRLLFATTNYVNRLDPALLRPGRMDVKIHYKMSTRDQIINLFKRFYPCASPESAADKKRMSSLELTPPPTPDLSPSDSDEPKSTDNTEKALMTSSDGNAHSQDNRFNVDTTPIYPPRLPADTVESLAQRFADAIPPNKFTVAELQGYLLMVKTRPFEAVDGVAEWMRLMEEERERIAGDEKEQQEKVVVEKAGQEATVEKTDESTPGKEDKEAMTENES